MTITEPTYANMAWLVAVQFLLYAAGWALCSLLLREQRPAVAHWGAFMLFVGVGFMLSSQRDEARFWWPYVGSNIAFTLGYAALCRGLDHFHGRAPRDLEHALTVGLVCAALLAAGPGEDQAYWRVLVSYAGGALMVTRALSLAMAPMRREFGPRLPWLVSAPGWLLALLFIARLLQQLLHPEHAFEMHRLSFGNIKLLAGYLVGAAMFNFSFMALLVTRLVGRLREQSRQDPLTGLANRRVLEHELAREWLRSRRGGGSFALLALDLDHFKAVNDAHGHAAGDQVLAQLAQRLRSTVRRVDVVARTGGEEFIVLMPQADRGGALASAERLRACVAALPFEVPGQTLAVTISVGVALPVADDQDPRQVAQRADRALYAAKEAGRNRVELA